MSEGKQIPQKPVLEVLCAIQAALDDENQRIFAMTGMSLGRKWGSETPAAASAEDLMQKVAAYLQDEFKLAASIEAGREANRYVLKMRGCHICNGDMVRERHGIVPACAMSMFPVGAAVTNLKIRSARLVEIRKPGPTGDCDMIYDIRG